MTKYLSGAVVEEVHLAPRVHQHFRAIAIRHDVSVSDLLSEALRRVADSKLPSAPATAGVTQARAAVARPPRPKGHSLHNHRERVLELIEAGLSDSAIAKELGFAQPTVSAYRRNHLGVPSAFRFNGHRAGVDA